MATDANALEENLNDVFVKKAPGLPGALQNILVEWAPVISIIIGIISLFSAWTLWHWARAADKAIQYANQVCGVYGNYGCGIATSRFSVWLWLSVMFLAAEGLLYVFAYSGLKARKKQGWNYLYYGALLNVAYAVISLFTSYSALGHFISALIGSAIGFYVLFQIRNAYLGTSKRPATPVESPKK